MFAFVWVDTRDMLADGTTKGFIDRVDLHDCMQGEVRTTHEIEIWRPKRLPNGSVQLVQVAPAGLVRPFEDQAL